MKDKGFTLIELLAVIVLLGIIITIAVPNIISVSKKSRQSMYETKVDMIVRAAELYGNDYHDSIKDSGPKKITVEELINRNYIKKEKKECSLGINCITDPRNNNGMDKKNLCLCIINKKPKATYIANSTTCNENVCKSSNVLESY